MTIVIDWFRVLADLKRIGWSIKAIELVTGIPSSSLDRYRNSGAQPRHEVGERLILLWCGATAKLRTDLPTMHLDGEARNIPETGTRPG